MSFHPNPASSESGSSSAPTTAGATTAWRNSLKQDFVRVPGTATQFSVWKTRVADFAAFVADHAVNEGYDYRRGCAPEILRADGYKNRGWDFGWNNPGFPQDRDHPVACVDWEDARSFCRWLTAREHRGGTLPGDRCYRLPTDSEWSCAVGLGGIEGPGTPRQKSRQIEGVFPWGTAWPPPPGSGNYCGEECAGSDLPAGWTLLAGYRDSFPFTSPVGSFAPNRFGLFDLGGNVWEWCEDWFDESRQFRVVRGASWAFGDAPHLLSSSRGNAAPTMRRNGVGFRLVLAEGSSKEALP